LPDRYSGRETSEKPRKNQRRKERKDETPAHTAATTYELSCRITRRKERLGKTGGPSSVGKNWQKKKGIERKGSLLSGNRNSADPGKPSICAVFFSKKKKEEKVEKRIIAFRRKKKSAEESGRGQRWVLVR